MIIGIFMVLQTNIKMTQRYSHIAVETLRATMQQYGTITAPNFTPKK